MKGQEALFSSSTKDAWRDEWQTPKWLFDQLNNEYHFNVDAAATYGNHLCEGFFTKINPDALSINWYSAANFRQRFWLNPPYSKIAAFMNKAYEESLKGATVVCLIPARTDTRYWHDYCMKASEIRFIKKRVKFDNPAAPAGLKISSATFPSAVVIFDERMRRDNWNNPLMCAMVKA
jgi:phage N-6-adenine-methyltransferase